MAPSFRMSVIEGRISAILNAATSGAPPLFLSAVPASITLNFVHRINLL